MSKYPIPHSLWEWYGLPSHLVVGARCRFHMTTIIGGYFVSTVGFYFQNDFDDEPTEIGSGRLFETYLFKNGPLCECGCGNPAPKNHEEIASYGGNSPQEAREYHMQMCNRVASGEFGDPK